MSPDRIIKKVEEVNEVKKKNKQKWPKVSIIILNWNGWKDTIECLESVFRNNYSNYQVIVVDNGSTDGSMEKIKAWAEGKQEVLTPEPIHPLYNLSHPPVKKPIPYIYYTRKEAEEGGNLVLEEKTIKKWQKIREANNKFNFTSPYPLIFIQTGENVGFAGGNNVGLRYLLAKDDRIYTWLLNNDTVIDKNALIEMIKLAESDEKIGMVGPKLLFYDETNLIEAIGGSSINLKTLSSYAYFEEDKGQWDKLIEPNYITGASVLAKKYLINSIGLLDEAYFMYIEDVDWSLKAKSEGYKLNYCYKSMIWHKKGSSTGTSGNWSNFLGRKSSRPNVKKFAITYYYNIRNKIYFVRKHFKSRFIIYCFIYTPFNILRLIIGIFVYNDNNKFKRIRLILKAWRDGIIGNMGKLIDVYHINI